MFQKDDLIVYGSTGVCRVDDIGRLEDVRGTDDEKIYYTLHPVYQTGVIYAPTDTTVFMRPILSRQAVESLILKIPTVPADSFPSCDQKLLFQHYRSALETHECEDLVQLIKTVSIKSKECMQNGKKPAQMEQRYLKRAEELLYGEFAAALEITPEDVQAFIWSQDEEDLL